MSSGPASPHGALSPLGVRVFRMLWLAWLAANVSLWMHEVAAAWMMTSLTTHAAMVAGVTTASTLPMFLLGLPSGALADIVDRRRYFAATQLWAAAIAIMLVVLSLAGWLSAPMLLVMTFLNGITMAMRWPVFSAIVPGIVPRDQLSAALALNGVAMNLSRIVGPALAGALLSALGSSAVFSFNAVLSTVAFVLIWRWRSPHRVSALPGERFVGAMRVGVQHVRQSPRMKVALVRIGAFMLQAAALLSLLPLVVRGLPDAGAGSYAALLAAMGAGAIVAVWFFPRLRNRFSRDAFVRTGTLAHALAALSVAFAPNVWLAGPGMFVAGAAVMSCANSITVSAQLVLPDWVRARGMAIYQMALMGGSAIGALLWGQVATWFDVRTAIVGSVAFAVLALVVTRRLSVEGVDPDAQRPAPVAEWPEPAITIEPDDGPVMVTVEYLIDPARAAEFAAVMQATRAARLRQGALSWGLFRDSAVPGRYVEYFVDETWLEHRRRQERFTAGDIGLREQRLAFHIGGAAPAVRRLVAETMVD